MQFETWTKALAELPVDCLAVGVHDDGELTAEAQGPRPALPRKALAAH